MRAGRTGDAVEFTVEPIGYVRAARTEPRDDFWGGTIATIELADGVDHDALTGIEEFSHAEIVFLFDRVDEADITTGTRHPRGNPDWPRVGIFAQRGKGRPNRIGTSMVKVLAREGRTLRVAELDAIDGTPVLDIKPVMKEFLPREPVSEPAWAREVMRRYWDSVDEYAPGPQDEAEQAGSGRAPDGAGATKEEGTMDAIVVYESLWGNTAAIAGAIAEGLGEGARALSTAAATPEAVAAAGLIVAGAPLLGFDLPTEDMRRSIGSRPGTGPAPDLSSPSMRSWVEALAPSSGSFATFETRIWWSPGSAARKIATLLEAKGLVAAAMPEKFLVTGRYGPLKKGELERARAWGAQLASTAA